MTALRDRSGFTMVETMVSTAIAMLVFIAVAATFIFCYRMFRITMEWDDTTESPESIRLVWRTDSGKPGGYFFNERRPHNAPNISWFKPNEFRLRQEWQQTVDLPIIRLNLGSPDTEMVHEPGWILLPQ